MIQNRYIVSCDRTRPYLTVLLKWLLSTTPTLVNASHTTNCPIHQSWTSQKFCWWASYRPHMVTPHLKSPCKSCWQMNILKVYFFHTLSTIHIYKDWKLDITIAIHFDPSFLVQYRSFMVPLDVAVLKALEATGWEPSPNHHSQHQERLPPPMAQSSASRQQVNLALLW